MKDKLEVGMYVRTTDGLLWKPKKIEIDEDGCYLFDGYYYFEPEQIYKSSNNLIDLIEVEDYVNGEIVIGFGTFYYDDGTIERTSLTLDITVTCLDSDIKSIVTKELYKSVEYEVEQ